MTHPPPEPPPATCPTCLTPAGEQNPCKSGKFQDQVQITFAVHLIESGVEVNVIRAWLGHADLSTTNRYAVCQKLHQTGEPNGLLRQLQG